MGDEQDAVKVHFSVAFTAHLDGNDDEVQRVPFDTPLSESSESTYDIVEKEFRCTIPGSYFFTFTILPQIGKGASVSLMKNDAGQVLLFAAVKKKHSVCSQSAILNLTTGDKVWLQLNEGNYGIRSHAGVPMVTFTGILVN